MKDLDLQSLRCVIALSASRNFRVAAAQLDISRSALSRAVARLEADLGVRLFRRTTRSVFPTDEGEAFLSEIHGAVGTIDGAVDRLNRFRSMPRGTLRISTSEGMALQLMQPIFLAFLAAHPEMSLDIVADGKFVDIVAEGFDAGIRFAEAVPRDMIGVKIGSDRYEMAVVASPKYLDRLARPSSPHDLSGHDCIRLRMPGGAMYSWEFTGVNRAFSVQVPGRLTVNSYALAIEAALGDQGIAYTGYPLVRKHVAEGRLCRLLEEWTPPFPGLQLYYPMRSDLSAGLKAFVDFVRRHTNETVP